MVRFPSCLLAERAPGRLNSGRRSLGLWSLRFRRHGLGMSRRITIADHVTEASEVEVAQTCPVYTGIKAKPLSQRVPVFATVSRLRTLLRQHTDITTHPRPRRLKEKGFADEIWKDFEDQHELRTKSS
jgi:hypothetical protein